MIRIHCPRCSRDFTDPREDLRDGDEAICPHCGARHLFRCGAEDKDGGDARCGLIKVNGTAAGRNKMPR